MEVALVSFTSEPAPEITPESVCAALDEYSSVAPLAMLMAPAYVPLPRLPALPICSVPALTVVVPL